MRYCILLFYLVSTNLVFSQSLTVRDVIDRMLVEMDTEILPGSVDTLKSGDWDQTVTGIATTFLATLDVLKRAEEEGLNLVITHEPTYYNHFDDKKDLGDKDPVVAEKLGFIEEHGLVVFRFHDLPHQIEDDMINVGLVKDLGWEPYHLGDMIFTSAYPNLGDLVRGLAKHFNSSTVRVVGIPAMKIRKIAIVPGAYGRQMQIQKFNSPDIDVLIVGESREWETVEYVRDARELGIEKGLIVMGHADSEEPGMKYIADWLNSIFPEIPVKLIPAGNPLWSPK